MVLILLRVFYVLVAGGLATLLVSELPTSSTSALTAWSVFFGVLALAGLTIFIDVLVPQKRIDIISAVYFGLLVGVILTYVVGLALTPLLRDDAQLFHNIRLLVGMVLCYGCISILIQTKDDFRFVIPYIEFAKEVKGGRPYVLDTSVVIDGRIADLVETNILDNQLIMPRFILTELQAIADSSDRLRRSRGRRGLDILNRLRSSEHTELKIYDREPPELDGQPVDMKLILLAKSLDGKVITGDYNLNRVACLHNVPVINLNDIANALKPVFLPGETLEVTLVRPGESPTQGVGYLDDGTMIVVEEGRDHVNEVVRAVVTSVLQTSAGRMIFGRYEAKVGSGSATASGKR